MSWLTELLKNLTISRSTTGALFIATLALLVLPPLASKYVQPVPNQWQWLVIGLCLFSAALLSFWSVKELARAYRKLPSSRLRSLLPEPRLSELELAMLLHMGTTDPNAEYDLNFMEHKKIPKLELLQACRRLEKYGYVEHTLFRTDEFMLTHRGIDRAHNLLRTQRNVACRST